MNANDTDPKGAADAGAAAELSAAEAAPKKRRAPAKAKATEPQSAADAVAAEPTKVVKPRAPRKTAAKAAELEAPAAPAEEAAPAKRAPRKRAAAGAEAVQQPSAEPVIAAAQEAQPERQAERQPEAKAVKPKRASKPRDVQAEDAAPSPAPLATAGEAEAAQGEDVGGERDSGESNEEREERAGRGSRNRRRGRRNRDGEGAREAGAGDRAQARPARPAEAVFTLGEPIDDDGETAEAGDAAPRTVAPEQVRAEVGERFAQLLAGEFDGEAEAPAEEAVQDTKRVLAPEPDAPKLQKVLAQAGVGSRRDIEDMIAEGKISVNGEVAHIGQRISFGDRVAVAGRPIKVRISPPAPRIIAYHKPAGEVVTHNDPEGRPTVFRRLPRLQNGKWQSVGRLDLNTEGLLLFTNSGELANQLMHPRFGVEREYAVRVLGTLSDEARAKLLAGVEIEGQAASFKSIEDGGGEGVNHWYRVIITEGRNREVRKLFDAVGLTVSRLIRIRYGTVVLPRGLKRGVWVELDDNDVRVIRRLAGARDDRGDRGERGERGGEGRGPRGAERGADRGPDRGERNERGGRGGRNEKRRADGRQAGVGPRPSRPEPRADRPDRPDRPERDRFNESRGEDRPRERSDEDDDDFIPRNINPLEQTFDRRFAGNKGRGIPSGFGSGGSGQHGGGQGRGGKGKPAGGPREPDPMQTSVGYIGGDAFLRRGGGNRGGGGGNRGGGGGGRGRR
ncbi:pseudouridine synthase [Paucibacter sp. APW11]|uniref:Pseudouridine synthase n=1 Tax=Roseateles aquae TaxID=3077235 RepID=A0ABU3P7H6_9BURK|nr:pseudouridine synthase [Paucibacter sp. APW11]MDT8998524.1 pseudouridine synthase [Paucibacter sp. APW11]